MKNIWIDGYEANVKQRVGSGQVAFNLIENIEKIDFENNYTILVQSFPHSDLPREREGFKYKVLKPNRLWTRIALPITLFSTKHKPDVFFSPTHYLPRFIPKGIKKVVTIFDLSYLYFPNFFPPKDLYKLKNWTKFSIENADHIMTISKYTKKDILKNYPKKTLDKRITVSYPGYDEKVFNKVSDEEKIKETKDKYKIEGEYIIYIGTLQPRKNLAKLIEAISKIENLKLVIVGKTTGEGRQGWMFQEILEKPNKLGIEEKIIFTGFVPKEELPYLLKGGVAFILPSLYEGFGIPAVEAMASGVPVLVSNVSSLPEVVGDAGLLFNPNSVDQMEVAIRTIFTDKKLRLSLSKKGVEHAKKFSWKKMAKDTIKVFESI